MLVQVPDGDAAAFEIPGNSASPGVDGVELDAGDDGLEGSSTGAATVHDVPEQ